MALEGHFDVEFVAGMAFREKQIQQTYRPFIGIHKWFARRPGTLFRALLLAEFLKKPLQEAFFETNSLEGLRVADPFMGGGTPLAEANRLGCHVLGYDISPMSHWIVRQVFESIDIPQYIAASNLLKERLREKLRSLYQTTCQLCLKPDADAKYFLWVRTRQCRNCGHTRDSFRNNLIAVKGRHPTNVFACPHCGTLTETKLLKGVNCRVCATSLESDSSKVELADCPNCEGRRFDAVPSEHRLFAIEYYCSSCKAAQKGRFFKKPDSIDFLRLEQVKERWSHTRSRFVPEDEIIWGPETNRLRKYGYRRYRDLFNDRQLLSLELTAREISRLPDSSIKRALFTNLSDLLRYQNMLCRYDVKSLKSLDVFSFHGFPVNVVQCESNFLGILKNDGMTLVGSGGWANIVEKYKRAKLFCGNPYEISNHNGTKTRIPVSEWIGHAEPNGSKKAVREVIIRCKSSTSVRIRPQSLDAVLTDPPYLNNVQYSELMEFCAVWLARFVPEFSARRTHFLGNNLGDLSCNLTKETELSQYALDLQETFGRFARGLKPKGIFAFTFHHNRLEVYAAVVVALLNARLRCTYCFPCPSEMSASIHILGRNSSRVDMVFVCRKVDARKSPFVPSLGQTLKTYKKSLEKVGLRVEAPDERSILFGLAACLTAARLEKRWRANRSIVQSLNEVIDDMKKRFRVVKGKVKWQQEKNHRDRSPSLSILK